MKLLIFQLRRPFRSGQFLNAQRRAINTGIETDRLNAFNYSEISIEEFDQYWYQQQHRAIQRWDEDQSEISEDITQSWISSEKNIRFEDKPFEGAYDGIMSIFDNPQKSGKRFCDKSIETKGDFQHRSEIHHFDLENKSEKTSHYRDNASSHNDVDSVKAIAIENTKGMIRGMRAEYYSSIESSVDGDSDCQSLAESLDYEVLSSD